MTPPNPAWMIIALLTTAAFAGFITLPETGHGEAEPTTTPIEHDPDTIIATNGATVTLLVHSQFTELAGLDPGSPDALPGAAQCELEVASGANGGDVLDEGVAAGCITEWSYDDFDGSRFVVSIDFLRAEGLTCLAWEYGICQFWEFRVNGETSEVGIDDYSVEDGDEVEFFHSTLGE